MPQNAIKQEAIYLPLFKLDAEFQTDKVDISIFEFYKNETDKHKKYWLKHNRSSTVWDFSLIQNQNIKLEYKFFIQEKIKAGQRLGTFVGYKRNESLFFEYLNNFCMNYTSITDISAESYNEFLFKKGVKEYKKERSLSKDLKIVENNSSTFPYLFLNRIKTFVIEFNDRNIPEVKKDIWNIDKLHFKVIKTDCSQVKNLNFSFIHQAKIKESVKYFTELRLHTKAIHTVAGNLNVISQFFQFIKKNFSNVNDLSDLTRDMIERYIAFMRTSARSENYIAHHLGALNTFFSYMQLCEDIDDKPDFCLILNSDYKQETNQDVKFFTDNEMKQIFAHIDELDEQIARMLYVHVNCGMRISELCLLKPSQLEKIDENSYYVYIYQDKTIAENKLPIQKICYEILQKAYKVSCEKYGDETKYIFAQSKIKPIQPRTYSEALNWMSYNNNLKFDDGTPLHITSHSFRATLATKLVNLGFDVDITNKILGHSGKTSIKSYLAVTTDDHIKYLENQIKRQGEFISSIGKPSSTTLSKNESSITLDNGYCSKSGSICESANACLSCSMFVPSKKHLSKYKTQLQSVEQNIYICKQNDLKKELEFNHEQKRLLERIIQKLQEE